MIKIPTTRVLRTAQAMALLLACGTAAAQTALVSSVSPVAVQNSVKLTHVIAALPTGTPWMKLSTSTLCIGNSITKTWTEGRAPQDLPPYAAAFKTELERAGYKVITPGEDNLFDAEAGAADYEIAAVITDEQIDGCISKGNPFSNDGPAGLNLFTPIGDAMDFLALEQH
jgi:hypothetical protein